MSAVAARVASALRRHPVLAAGLALAGVALAVALLSLAWTPYPPARIAMARRLQPPSALNWLGTDHFGRDVASLVMAGLRNSLAIAAAGVALGAALGVALGATVAAIRGAAEEVAMRVVDFAYAFPAVLAAVVIAALLGAGPVATVVAIAVANAALFARLVRAAAVDLWTRDFVRATLALGRGRIGTVFHHVLPNLAGLVAVQAATQLAVALLVEAGLSYLGLGLQPPDASLGRMLNDAQTHLAGAPTLAIFPGLALALAVLAAGLVGDGLRDLIDPRTARAVARP